MTGCCEWPQRDEAKWKEEGGEDPSMPSQSTPEKQRTGVQVGTRGAGAGWWDIQREALRRESWAGEEAGASQRNGGWKPEGVAELTQGK